MGRGGGDAKHMQSREEALMHFIKECLKQSPNTCGLMIAKVVHKAKGLCLRRQVYGMLMLLPKKSLKIPSTKLEIGRQSCICSLMLLFSNLLITCANL